jgi:hypothetical protein
MSMNPFRIKRDTRRRLVFDLTGHAVMPEPAACRSAIEARYGQ